MRNRASAAVAARAQLLARVGWRARVVIVIRSDRGVLDAGLDFEGFAAALDEGLVLGQHHGRGPDLLVFDVDPGGSLALVAQGFHGPPQLAPGHDDAAVGGDQLLLGPVHDRAHALLQRRVLHGDALDPGVGVAALLGRAVHQVVVVLVGQGPVAAAGLVLVVHAVALQHRLPLGLGEGPGRVVVEAVHPAVLVVDRDPEVPVHRVVTARRDHREAGHDPGGDPPVVVVAVGVAADPDEQATLGLDDLE